MEETPIYHSTERKFTNSWYSLVDLGVRVPLVEELLGGALEELPGGALEGFLWWSIGDGFLWWSIGDVQLWSLAW